MNIYISCFGTICNGNGKLNCMLVSEIQKLGNFGLSVLRMCIIFLSDAGIFAFPREEG